MAAANTVSPPGSDERIFRDVACTICGCVCDDLTVRVRDQRVVGVERACPLSEPWFLGLGPTTEVSCRVRGEAVSWSDGIRTAADLLRDARAPLIYGLSRSSTSGQRAAVRLADQLGAGIDTTASRCHAPSIMAIQQVGESTCSLGEVANRCDLVVYWGSNPVDSHPRHGERYAVERHGMFIPNGRSDRQVVVIDVCPTPSTDRADWFLQVARGKDFDLIWALRHLLRGHPIDDIDPQVIGITRDEIVRLLDLVKSCRSGVFFFGLGLTRGPHGAHNVEGLLRLVADLNAHTRFYARRMRVYGDVTGADSVLCWQTGFPFSVNLARGYPRYNPGEYSANELLMRREVDVAVIVGSEALPKLAPVAFERLRNLPTIVLDYPGVTSSVEPTVRFTTAIYGVHRPGTAYRMDETPIPLRTFLSSDLPSDDEVLTAIGKALQGPESQVRSS